jgi:DNA-binding CsgD family transcriptional regulator
MAIPVELGTPRARRVRKTRKLTTTEQRILARATTGWSITAIADTLGLAPEAVDRSLAAIIRRLGACSKMEAALIAVRRGLIDLPSDTAQSEARASGYLPSADSPVKRLLEWASNGTRNADAPPAHQHAPPTVTPDYYKGAEMNGAGYSGRQDDRGR